MIYQRYGIVFERLSLHHIEMVREWRNQDFVRLRMRFQDYISAQAQLLWFENLHPDNDWYFLCKNQDTYFGLFNIKNINRQTKTGESSAFVYHRNAVESLSPALAIVALMEFGFEHLELEYLTARYHPDFREIANLNTQLGYEILSVEEDGYVKASVGRLAFYERTVSFRKAAEKMLNPPLFQQ